MGISNIEQLKENAKALEKGPMSEDELDWMKKFGDLVYNQKRALLDSKNALPTDLK